MKLLHTGNRQSEEEKEGVIYMMESGCMTNRILHSMILPNAPSTSKNSIARKMEDRTLTISDTDGNPVHVIFQGTNE